MMNPEQELMMTRAAFFAFALILTGCGSSSYSSREGTSQEVSGSAGENSVDGSGGNEAGSGSGATPGHSGADNSGGSSGALDTGGSGGTPETGGSAAVENQAGEAGSSTVVSTGGVDLGTGGVDLGTGGVETGGSQTGGVAGSNTGGSTGGLAGTGGSTGGTPPVGGTGGSCVPIGCPTPDPSKEPCFYNTIDDGCGNPIQCPATCSDMNYCDAGICRACTSQLTDEEICNNLTGAECGFVHRPYVSPECDAPANCMTNFNYDTCYPWYTQCDQNCTGIETCELIGGPTGICNGCRLGDPTPGGWPCQNVFHPTSGNQLYYRYDCDDAGMAQPLPLDQCLLISGPYWCCETNNLG